MDKQDIFAILDGAIKEVLPFEIGTIADLPQEGNDHRFLVDFGINSIDYAYIVHIVMEKLDLDCSLDAFANTNNVQEIVDLFHDLAHREG